MTVKLRSLSRTLLVAALAFTTTSLVARAENVTIRYSNWLPPGYFLYEDVIKPWKQEVERVTEGRVTFEVTPKPVGAVAASYDTVAEGLADMSAIVPAYTPGRFIGHEGVELPWLGDDPEKRSLAVWRAYQNYLAPAGEFKDIKVLGVFFTNTAHLITTKAEISKLEDFRGLKLRSPNQPTTQALELLGAIAVTKPISEVYELASGGMIDGLLTNADAAVGFKLNDVMRKITYLDGGITATTTMIGMNYDTWNTISEADKAAIEAISGEALALRNGAAQLKNLLSAQEKFKQSGVETILLDPKIMEQMRMATAPVTENWIARSKERGFDKADAMLADFRKDYDSAPSSR